MTHASAFRVYVVAPFSRASFVSAVVHPDMVELGATPTSTWADSKHAKESGGVERLEELTPQQVHDAWQTNHVAVATADCVLALLDEHQPREGFVELAEAFRHRVHVVMVGRHCLSTRYWELGGLCTVARSYGDALTTIRGKVVRHMRAHGIMGGSGR